MISPRERLRRWFFKRQGTESAPILLDRRRIYILPTGTGLLYSVALVVMYIGAVNYNLGLGHALVFLLVGLGLTGMLHTFRNLVGLRIHPGRVTTVFAGETTIFEILLENARGEIRPGIHLQKFSDNATLGNDKTLSGDIEGHGVTPIKLPIVATHRGRMELPRLIISTRYPLGLFRAWSYPWPRTHCLVYPKPLYSNLPPPATGDYAVGRQTLNIDGQDDFAGFRQHQPGDSPRHVAWKVYARNATESPLLVKEFSSCAAAQCSLRWDQTSATEDTEIRLSTLCGWVLQAQKEGLTFDLQLPGLFLPTGSGEQQVNKALEALALFGQKE